MVDFTLYTGFGPKIGVFAVEPDHFKTIKTHADKILDNPEDQIDHGKELAGQIRSEPAIVKNEELYAIFRRYVGHYVTAYMKHQELNVQKFDMKITSSWLVDQKPGEYNPPHFHGNCNISSVMYLEVPQVEEDKELLKKKRRADGWINFNNNSMRGLAEFETGGVSWEPTVGMLYVFPARLVHSVNPWKGKGRRISLSFNTQVDFKKK